MACLFDCVGGVCALFTLFMLNVHSFNSFFFSIWREWMLIDVFPCIQVSLSMESCWWTAWAAKRPSPMCRARTLCRPSRWASVNDVVSSSDRTSILWNISRRVDSRKDTNLSACKSSSLPAFPYLLHCFIAIWLVLFAIIYVSLWY